MDSNNKYSQEEFAEKIKIVIKEIEGKLIEREVPIRLVVLVILAKQHIFLIGVPGTAKTKLLTTVCNIVEDGSLWQKLMTKETQEYHLVGFEQSSDPISRIVSMFNPEAMLEYVEKGKNLILKAILKFFNIKAMLKKSKEDIEVIKKESMLYHQFIFFDEMFKAKPELLVSTLPMLNERYYTSKGKAQPVPLITLCGASNELPFGELIAPFTDRFLAFLLIEPIQLEENYFRYINEQFDKDPNTKIKFTLQELEVHFMRSRAVKLPEKIQHLYIQLEREISRAGIEASNRKFGPDYIISALKVSAYGNNRLEINISDLFLIEHFAWHTFDDRKKLQVVIHDTLFANKDSVEGEINNILKDQERATSFFNQELQVFLSYDEEYFGGKGAQIYNQRLSQLNSYYEEIGLLNERMRNIKELFKYCNHIEAMCANNTFLYGIKCHTFENKEYVRKMETFLSEKSDEIEMIRKWARANREMADYQENKMAMKIGKCEVVYKF